MKKRYQLFFMTSVLLLSVFCAAPLMGEQLSTLNGNQPLGQGEMNTPVFFSEGDVSYLFYSAGDRLEGVQSNDGGATFVPVTYAPGVELLSSVRNLQYVDAFQSESVFFFTAVREGKEGIYGLGINDEGEADFFVDDLVDNMVYGDRVLEYHLIKDVQNGVAFFIKPKRLWPLFI